MSDDDDLTVPESFKDKPFDDRDIPTWNKRCQVFLRRHGSERIKETAGVANVAQVSGMELWLHEDTVILANGACFPSDSPCKRRLMTY
jgi:hypothetical protein